jgi:DNA-binding transcriptional regulator PaaX
MTQKQQKKTIRENYNKGELAKEILKGLTIGGLIVASIALPNLPQIFSLIGIKNAKDRYRIKRAIKKLEKQKFIEIYEKGDKEIIEITEKGKKRVLIYKFDEIKITRPKKWDKLWRIVSFDIPERYKKERKALSNKLKEMEIYPLQKSVFICPFECKDEINFVSEVLSIRKYVYYFLAKEIDEKNEIFLKKYYNL